MVTLALHKKNSTVHGSRAKCGTKLGLFISRLITPVLRFLCELVTHHNITSDPTPSGAIIRTLVCILNREKEDSLKYTS